MFGVGYGFLLLEQSGALVHIYNDGSVLLSHGGVEMGQGLFTKMIQVGIFTVYCSCSAALQTCLLSSVTYTVQSTRSHGYMEKWAVTKRSEKISNSVYIM